MPKTKVTRFELDVIADFGSLQYEKMVVPRLKQKQSSIIVESVDASVVPGDPIRTRSVLRMLGHAEQEDVERFIFETLRSTYAGPSMIISIGPVMQTEEDIAPGQ